MRCAVRRSAPLCAALRRVRLCTFT